MNMKPKKKAKIGVKKSLKEQISLALELPQEVVMDMPNITLVGNTEISVENFAGLLEYTQSKIRLNTKVGPLTIEGEHLEAKSMTAEVITIRGQIKQILFI